jgi:fermentation-respiration switch protein FrsA (DUF1100 family)
MHAATYQSHRSQIGSYVDRSAAYAWVCLTSDALELFRK